MVGVSVRQSKASFQSGTPEMDSFLQAMERSGALRPGCRAFREMKRRERAPPFYRSGLT